MVASTEMICSISSTSGSSRVTATISRKKLLWRYPLLWVLVVSFSATYQDILGLEQVQSAQQLRAAAEPALRALAEELAERITAINGGAPSAVFLAGGGSKLSGLRPQLAGALGMDERRIAVAGRYFQSSAVSDAVELNDPVYTTPLGIAISAGLGLISDSYRVLLNGAPAKLFRNGGVTAMELLMMNGYRYGDFISRGGRPLAVTVDGERRVFYGEPGLPAELALNDVPVQPSAVVHPGDRITFSPARAGADRAMTAGELAGLLSLPGLNRDGVPLSPDAPIRPGDQLTAAEGQPRPRAQQPAPGAPEPPRPLRLRPNGQPLSLPPKPDGVPYYLMDLLERSGLDFQHLDCDVSLLVNGRDSAFQQVLQEGDAVEILRKS